MDIGARCESSFGSSKDNSANRSVRLELAQCLVELKDEGRTESIEGFGTVELDLERLVSNGILEEIR